ncbi:MAG: ribbon-helix-helix domain-containing protein [Candidatus Bathyarchaeota archaeon]|nr:ribbon-helix-helix domain-containing protein [Candidatus Bathyarchaeum tardum]WGM88697.1 MAG: ribbon-helix-helix domain-containing protein [Candidatus Bathyarchaeum tardum]
MINENKKRERITIRLTARYMELLNKLTEQGVYNSRNEAIRAALRLLYEHHELKISPTKNMTQHKSQPNYTSRKHPN